MVKATANIDPLTGKVYIGRGHGYVMAYMFTKGACVQVPGECQAFVDENGEWLDREEAWIEAKRCGQIDEDYDYTGNQTRLYSEDIWEQLPQEFSEIPPTERTLAIAKKMVDEYGIDAFTCSDEKRERVYKTLCEQEFYVKLLGLKKT